MSVVDRQTSTWPAPGRGGSTDGTTPPDQMEFRARAGTDHAAWAGIPAIVTAGVSALVFADPTSAAAVTIGVAALAFSSERIQRTGSTEARTLSRAHLMVLGTIAGALVGGGTVIAHWSVAPVSLAARLAMVWFATLSIATLSPRRSIDRDADAPARIIALRHRLAATSAAAVVVVALGAIVVEDLRRATEILAFALPLAFGIFWATDSDDGRGHPTWKPVVRAILAGATAAVVASTDLTTGPGDTTTVSLAVIVVVAGGVGWIAHRSPRWFGPALGTTRGHVGSWRIAIALALATGLGAGALPAVALTTAFVATVVHRAGRPAPALAPSSARSTRIVGALTAVGLLIRLFTGRGLWLDETTSVFQAKKPLVDMIRFIYETDNHPPLHHLVMWADIRLVGDSEFALRLPMMLMGAALIPAVYLIGRELFDRRVGVYAAALTTVAPVAVWYGQEARMYSQFMLLAAISVYSLARILRTGSNRHWVVFTLASVALVYTQYFAVLHVIATLVVLVVETFRRRSQGRALALFKGLAKTVIAQTLLIAPLVPFALTQAARNQQEGFGLNASGITSGSQAVPPPGIYGFLTNIQWVFLGYLPDDVSIRLVALWPIGMLLLLLVLGTQRRTSNRILLTIAGLPMIVVFGASFVADESRSLAEVRYFAGAVPLLFILLVAGIVAVARTRRTQFVVVGSVVTLMCVALVVQQFDRENPRLYEYREAIEQIRAVAEPGDRVVFAPEYLNYTFDYYDPTVPDAPLEDGLPTPGEHSIFVVEGASFSDSAEARTEVSDALADLVEQGQQIDAVYEFAQITVWKVGSPS